MELKQNGHIQMVTAFFSILHLFWNKADVDFNNAELKNPPGVAFIMGCIVIKYLLNNN